MSSKLEVHFWRPEFILNEQRLLNSPWPTKRLGELAPDTPISPGVKDGPGGWLINTSEYVDNGIPVIRATNVTEFEIDIHDAVYISPDKHAELSSTAIKPDDLLLTMRGSIGRAAIVPQSIPDANMNAAICRIRLANKEHNEFVRDFLNTDAGLLQSKRFGHKAVQGDLNLNYVRNFIIPFPSPEAQRELVAQMEAARQARKTKLAHADALLAGIDGFVLEQLGLDAPEAEIPTAFAVSSQRLKGGRFDALYHAPKFEKIARNLKACPHPKVKLGDISPDLAGGATPTRGNTELYTESGIKFLRIMNVAPYELNLSDIKYITNEVHTNLLARSQLRANDVLMTITGRVGTTAVVTDEILPANINQHIVRIRIQTSDCLPLYLAAYLNSSVGLALSNRGVTGGTRIALDYRAVRNLDIPLPPLEQQQRIIREVTRLLHEARQLREEAESEWSGAKVWFEQQLMGSG